MNQVGIRWLYGLTYSFGQTGTDFLGWASAFLTADYFAARRRELLLVLAKCTLLRDQRLIHFAFPAAVNILRLMAERLLVAPLEEPQELLHIWFLFCISLG